MFVAIASPGLLIVVSRPTAHPALRKVSAPRAWARYTRALNAALVARSVAFGGFEVASLETIASLARQPSSREWVASPAIAIDASRSSPDP
jgi:hypothetical protein